MSPLCNFFHSPVPSSPSSPISLLNTPFQPRSNYILPIKWNTQFPIHTNEQIILQYSKSVVPSPCTRHVKYISCSFLTSEVSGQRHPSAVIYPRERTPGTHRTWGWVDLTAGMDTESRVKVLYLCQRSNPGHPVVQSVASHYSHIGSGPEEKIRNLWQQVFNELYLLLISSWLQVLFQVIVSK
jgi:hypothetical protein